MKMKKQYTRIRRVWIAYKGNMTADVRYRVGEILLTGIISGTMPNGGWWIKAKEL